MKNKYIEAVESGNIVRVRLSLSNELMLDPRGDSFNEMKAFAESHMTNLYDEDDSKSYSMNVSDWNEELMFAIKNDLDDNFSKEKLSIYEKVAKTVLKDKAEQLTKEEATRATRIVSASNKARSSEQDKKEFKQADLYWYYCRKCCCRSNWFMSVSRGSCFFRLCWCSYWWNPFI